MKKSELQLNIISAEKTLFSGNVTSVVIPGIAGSFGVYPDHAPLISALKEGIITYVANNTEQSLNINGGIVEVNNGIATICVA